MSAGYNNAFTSYDITNYFEVVPSNYTETMIWMEAERLQNLNVSQDDFVTERKVVIGEYNRDVFGGPVRQPRYSYGSRLCRPPV